MTDKLDCKQDINKQIVSWLGVSALALILVLGGTIYLKDAAASAVVGTALGSVLGYLGATLTGKSNAPSAGPNTTTSGDVVVNTPAQPPAAPVQETP